MTNRLLVIVAIFAVLTILGYLIRNRVWWWAALLPFSIPAYFIGKAVENDLVGGGLMFFAIAGTGMGLLGLTHLMPKRQ
jgi:hypothetical protein